MHIIRQGFCQKRKQEKQERRVTTLHTNKTRICRKSRMNIYRKLRRVETLHQIRQGFIVKRAEKLRRKICVNLA